MPVVGQREPEKIAAVLERWLASRIEVDRVEISDLVIPQSSGFSNETFLLKARWGDRGAVPLVLRSQPQTHTLFPEIDLLQQQYLSMKLLGEHSNVPVPKVLWAESDPGVLGQPFFVMERRRGLVIRRTMPTTIDDTPALRRRIGDAAIDTLADLHAIPVEGTPLAALGKPAGFVMRQVRGWSERWPPGSAGGRSWSDARSRAPARRRWACSWWAEWRSTPSGWRTG